MARCGCGSTGATGAAMESTNCVNVAGAGTALDPFVVTLALAEVEDNLLECGAAGLYARAPQQTADDASISVTPGTALGDYGFAVEISAEAGNGLQLEPDGLYARANPIVITATPLFGVLPADPQYLEYCGTVVDTTNIAGHIVIPIFPSIDGISTIVYSVGDVPGVITNTSIDVSTVGLASFDVVFQDDGGFPIVGGTYRINYKVTAWYTP